MRPAQQIILRPLLTEKSSALQETGGVFPPIEEEGGFSKKFVFEVDLKANKPEIKRAVEELFDVKVLNVATLIQRGKQKRIRTRRGILEGKRKTRKKAIVTLHPGDSIELFEGV